MLIFAAYAVEAGLLLHRMAKRGVISFAEAVPLCTMVVLPALTVVPMLSLFWYCHDDVSFWNFLFLDPELAGTEDLEVLAQLSDAS